MSNYLEVNGKKVKTPSKFDPVLQDISSSESGRTLDGIMHKDRVTQKWKISIAWNNPTPQETSDILTTFDDVEFDVTFNNPKTNTRDTRRFYAGDRSAPVKQWFVDGERYSQVSFDIIEV